MNRQTLNGLEPRTVSDLTRDPLDCWDHKMRDNVLQFVGAMRPDAMERLQERKTRHVRRLHDSAAPTLYLDNSLLARVLRWIFRSK